MDVLFGGEVEVIGCMLICKQFYGDLDVISLGEMLVYCSGVVGLVGYVVMEWVYGWFVGCSGSFVFMYVGEMDCGQVQLMVCVVFDLVIGELIGLVGMLVIDICDGQYFYIFDYWLLVC